MTPVIEQDGCRIFCGDCIEVMRSIDAASFDSIVTDPPYELGFMGKAWDRSGIAYKVELWREALRVLKPGGHLLAFGGSRTYHRLACAVEDAGLEIRDQIQWIYGSGFPKSHNGPWGGTALKPAHEPIVMARKPLIGTVEKNVAEHGVGALNIDGCRVGSESTQRVTVGSPEGRWPANVIHDGSAEVVDRFPSEAGASGSAARFFYCAKADRIDRDEGMSDAPEKPLLWSSGTRSPGTFQAEGTKRSAKNNHPTVKPTTLMRYLLRLVTPPGGVALDPFLGSGSTAKAAVLEGLRVVGIEQNPEYVNTAVRRVRHVMQQPSLFGDTHHEEEKPFEALETK